MRHWAIAPQFFFHLMMGELEPSPKSPHQDMFSLQHHRGCPWLRPRVRPGTDVWSVGFSRAQQSAGGAHSRLCGFRCVERIKASLHGVLGRRWTRMRWESREAQRMMDWGSSNPRFQRKLELARSRELYVHVQLSWVELRNT